MNEVDKQGNIQLNALLIDASESKNLFYAASSSSTVDLGHYQSF